MRRAEKVLQALRRLQRRRIATVAEVDEGVEWSHMTVRRCIEDLEAMGVPIEAERGVGHRLKDYHIPGGSPKTKPPPSCWVWAS